MKTMSKAIFVAMVVVMAMVSIGCQQPVSAPKTVSVNVVNVVTGVTSAVTVLESESDFFTIDTDDGLCLNARFLDGIFECDTDDSYIQITCDTSVTATWYPGDNGDSAICPLNILNYSNGQINDGEYTYTFVAN